MKKILFALLISLCLLPCVKAEETTTIIEVTDVDFVPYSNVSTKEGCIKCGINLQNKYIYNNFDKFYSDPNNKYIFDTLWKDLGFGRVDYVSVLILSNSSTELDLFAVFITVYGKGSGYEDHGSIFYLDGTFYPFKYNSSIDSPTYNINGGTFYALDVIPHYYGSSPFIVGSGDFISTFFYLPTTSFTNRIKPYNEAKDLIIKVYNSNFELNDTIAYGDELPQLYEWNSFNPIDGITEVNLDNYEYVILNLKDYSKKEAFETNLQVKGSIAITPVYEFGTVEKETITDLCNTVYNDFTDYRFFILKNDLINNAVYIVKSCKGTNASFKYDSSLFDITYVTSENVNDPVVTFGGIDYHTIPFNKLSNTVNKNEEEGFIPGESEKFDPFGSVVDYISSFWSSLTTFMGLVTKFFNTLPIEIRAISITMFTTAITLGVIKFIKS